MTDNACKNCAKPLPQKPFKTISLINFNSSRYKLVKKENLFTNTSYYCCIKCRDCAHGGWIDCINPPKDAEIIEDDYPDEPDGQFYCRHCQKHTSQKTIWTTCIKCKNPLDRTGVLKI